LSVSGKGEIEIESPLSILVRARCAIKTLSGFRVLVMRNESLTSVICYAEVDFETWTIVYNTFVLSSSPLLVYQTLYIFM
jgi:hypothetical protein